MAKTLFEKIMDREIPGQIVHEDDLCIAIKDINPQAPVHLLVIPRKPLKMLSDATAEDQPMLGHLLLVANKCAKQAGFGEAFRLVVNNGAEACQSVFHVHIHVIAGRPLSWPPG